MPARMAAQCGTLDVPEDPEKPEGRRLDLRIAVISAVSHRPQEDALFFLAGGPGQAATEAFPAIAWAFDKINQRRDIVLVDQRGTGGSNALECTTAGDDDVATLDAAAARAWARDCLGDIGADVRQYTTAVAMADLDAVRAALGYPQISLYGGSYGTRAALAYLRQYPTRVRSVVLDGVVPPDLALGTTVARDAQSTLDRYIERCEADPPCRAAFPDLAGDLAEVLDRLRDGPVAVDLADPVTGEAMRLTVDHSMVGTALRFLSYSPDTAAIIPLLLHRAVETGDLGPLAAQYLRVTGDNAETLSLGMHFAVVCAEDVPFFAPDEVARLNADTYLADQVSSILAEVCQVWPRGPVPADFRMPVRSDVPALVLSGELDPVTPPAYGEAVARYLKNGRHIVAPGQGHGTIVHGCIQRLMSDFVDAGTVAGLDDGCLNAMAPADLFVSYSGPVPAPTDVAGAAGTPDPAVKPAAEDGTGAAAAPDQTVRPTPAVRRDPPVRPDASVTRDASITPDADWSRR